jgi:hypothetical protein
LTVAAPAHAADVNRLGSQIADLSGVGDGFRTR